MGHKKQQGGTEYVPIFLLLMDCYRLLPLNQSISFENSAQKEGIIIILSFLMFLLCLSIFFIWRIHFLKLENRK